MTSGFLENLLRDTVPTNMQSVKACFENVERL